MDDHNRIGVSETWKKHAAPFQHIAIEIQGTRHSSKAGMLRLLKNIAERIERGDSCGESSDDDFGYRFKISSTSESVFDATASHS